MRPGDQLPTEDELSAHYRVSRNTAREAIRSLAGQGLLVSRRGVGGGIFVAVPSAEHISHALLTSLTLRAENAHVSIPALVEMRALLEIPASQLAALRGTDEEFTAIRASLFDPRSVDAEEVFVGNRAFHVGILKAAHNPLLEIVAEPVFRVLQTRFARRQAPSRFWRQVDRDHRAILDRLEARDEAGARDATQAHLGYVGDAYARMERLPTR